MFYLALGVMLAFGVGFLIFEKFSHHRIKKA